MSWSWSFVLASIVLEFTLAANHEDFYADEQTNLTCLSHMSTQS